MSKYRRKLIDKFDIPISHLDFAYIKSCNNVREMEKIVKILRSGEEGYFEELTKCGEEKLKILDPNSKCFRSEAEIITRQGVDKTEWERDGEPVVAWSDEVKVKDNFLSVIANEKGPEISVPDIRGKNKKIAFTVDKNEKLKKDITCNNPIKRSENGSRRIKSTDYQSWGKYDADTECLKMELDEERLREENERNKIKREKYKPKEIINPVNANKEILLKLTNVEKEALSLKYKDNGNDYFRIKEYQNAIVEYTKCLEIYPTATLYNNRAVTYMKLFLYKKAIDDLEKCLEIESKNIKALLRKAQSYVALDKRRDAYAIYTTIISIEPSNVPARNGLNDLKKQLPDLPPPTATRILITENEGKDDIENKSNSNSNNNIEKLEENFKKTEEKVKDKSHKNIQNFIGGIIKNEGNDIKCDSQIKSKVIEIKDSMKKDHGNLSGDEKSRITKMEDYRDKFEDTKDEILKSQNIEKLNSKSVNINTEKLMTVAAKKLSELPESMNTSQELKSKIIYNKIAKEEQINKKNECEKLQKIPNVCTENKNLKENTIKDEDNYVQEDLSKLIIPKRIVKSKLAKTWDVLRNNKVPIPTPQMNKSQNRIFKSIQPLYRTSSGQPNTNIIKLLPDKQKDGVFIKEVR